MKIIYETKGKAAEYAPLSINIYQGCSHGCLYCFAPKATQKNRIYFHRVITPVDNLLPDLEEDCKILTGDKREILLCFETDPYQIIDQDLQITRKVISILKKHLLNFTILTKGGMRAARDFDLLAEYQKTSFGTTLIFSRQKNADKWEPEAASIEDRINAIKLAHKNNIPTWVSIEPVIFPDQCLELISKLHPFVEHWKIGKINYHPTIEQAINWKEFRKQVVQLLTKLNADFYIKKSLTDL